VTQFFNASARPVLFGFNTLTKLRDVTLILSFVIGLAEEFKQCRWRMPRIRGLNYIRKIISISF